jgi:threonine/homoserine/homoserine lactone efflux protein
MASSTAFALLKLAGAAYLCFIGLTMLLSRAPKTPGEIPAKALPASLRQVFWQGALTNVLNPKVALFFLAFLPQFVAAESPHKALAFILLGAIFIFNGTLWCLGVAAVAARTAGRITQTGAVALWINRTLGGLFIYLGIRIALFQARSP